MKEARFQFEQHCEDESLELYARGKLDEFRTEILEEHMLICEGCRERLDNEERQVRAFRSAAARIRSEEADRAQRSAWRLLDWVRMPASGWAAAVAALCGLAVLASFSFHKLSEDGPMANVELRAERGGANVAPAHHRLDLKLDVRGLQLSSGARAEIVDADGKVLENLTTAQVSEAVDIHTGHGFDSGTYFVRLYPRGATEAVREFALEVK